MESLITTDQYIGGEFVSGGESESLVINDKYSQEFMAEISFCSDFQLESAIKKSFLAFEKYKKFSKNDRSQLLYDLSDKLQESKEEFADLICRESGKPIDYARVEVERSIENLRNGARYVTMPFEENITFDNGLRGIVERQPIGLVAGITPFNFPLNLALHKIIPCLGVGNPIFIKPSPYTPLTILAFAKLVSQTALPEGMLNIIIAEDSVAQTLVKDDRFKFLSFTGSDKVGWKLKEMCRKKKVALELGGNAACIVDSFDDIEEVAQKVCHGSFLYSGQICISTQRVFVDNSCFDEFLSLLIDESEEIKCGDPSNENVIVGPLIDEVHLERIHEMVTEAINDGADLLLGGHILDEERNLYAPTILTNTSPDMRVVREEVFGPVVCVERTDAFEEAVELVNDSRYGLQAGVFTKDIDKMKYAFEHLEVGGVIINNVPGFRDDSMPYGGIKDSGIGREGYKYALSEMSELKLMVL